ncbi:MAG: FliO/MopB family protein [Verrucomicrobia bacterium]|nr:FliO/MopB family protein [Verrucomicrobiota bacterium]
MSLKKLLPILLLLYSSAAYSADKKQTPPPAAQEAAPEDSKKDTSVKPEAAPAAPAPAALDKAAQQPPAPLPSSTEMTTSYESAFVRMLVTLLGLLFLVFATFWILRRMGKGKFKMGSGRTINILEKRALSPKSMLYIVEIGNKKVLISESQVEVRSLATYEEIPDVNE